MSLLEEYAQTFILMEKRRESDGAGGFLTAWYEGLEFTAYEDRDTSLEMQLAEKQGITSVFSVMVDRELPIIYDDYYKDKATGLTYRVTSNPADKKSPGSSSIGMKYFQAERKDLPT